MKKSLLIFIAILASSFSFTSCQTTRYIEKTSEPMSRTVWAVKDSIDAGRFDLADQYVNELTKLVPVPNKKIVIQSIDINDDKEIKLNNTK